MQHIKVDDFGPIASAEVALTPLTVLIGANNTGKSYLALAIYSLTRAIWGAGPRNGTSSLFGLAGWPSSDRSAYSRFNHIMEESAESFPEYSKIVSGETKFGDWPHSVRQWLLQQSRSWSPLFSEELNNELRRCFGASLTDLGRRMPGPDNGDFRIEIRDDATGFNWGIRSEADELITHRWQPTEPDPSTILPAMRTMRRSTLGRETNRLASYLLNAYSRVLFESFTFPSHYLPASRTGILVGHKTLSSLIVASASAAWIQPLEIDRLPGVVTDLVRSLLLLDVSDTTSPELQPIVDFLETRVAKGRVDIQRQSSGYPAIIYSTDAGVFQLHQVSSTVSEIVPLIIFLKYYVNHGDLVILEEPESHLDAANQRNVARAISMMVNAGIRVLVTTHSDIFLNQIVNLVQASQVAPDQYEEFIYDESELLNPGDVSAYLFHDVPHGTVVKPLPVYPDEGLLTESFGLVHRALYDEAIVMEYGD